MIKVILAITTTILATVFAATAPHFSCFAQSGETDKHQGKVFDRGRWRSREDVVRERQSKQADKVNNQGSSRVRSETPAAQTQSQTQSKTINAPRSSAASAPRASIPSAPPTSTRSGPSSGPASGSSVSGTNSSNKRSSSSGGGGGGGGGATKPLAASPVAGSPTSGSSAQGSAAAPVTKPASVVTSPNTTTTSTGTTSTIRDAAKAAPPNAGSGVTSSVSPARNRSANDEADPRVDPATKAIGTDAAAAVVNAAALTDIYRVGVGDVLDVRLLNTPMRESTLYTVMVDGSLEYPLAGESFVAAGMTTDEVSMRLTAELKRRAVYDKPQVAVSVREYASHTIVVSGLVGDPGTKILRREAVPLYVITAEAQPRAEAGRVIVISRTTGQSATVDLDDPAAMNMLVHPGDVITVSAQPQRFFFIGGQVNSPGQKDYHAGMTLTQAILASGGVSSSADAKAIVSRQGPDGRLTLFEYNLKDINLGKVPDPRVQPGDRIEVSRGGRRYLRIS